MKRALLGHLFKENTFKPASTVGTCFNRLEILSKYRMTDKEKMAESFVYNCFSEILI